MHLSPPVAKAAVPSNAVVLLLLTFLFIVNPIVGVCYCSMSRCTLLYVHSSIAIILMGKRELVALLNLSSWRLVMVKRLFLAVPRGCLRFVIVVFPDHTQYFHKCLLGRTLGTSDSLIGYLPFFRCFSKLLYALDSTGILLKRTLDVLGTNSGYN